MSNSPKDNTAKSKEHVILIARLARATLSVVAGGLALIFTWLKFKNLDFGHLMSNVSANLLLQTSLAVYYLSWVNGVSSDVDAQEVLYVVAPERSRAIALCIAGTILIGITFGFLCYVTSYGLVLSAFFFFNIVCWITLTRWVLPRSIQGTIEYYAKENAYLQLIELTTFVDDYLRGAWQTWRYVVGGVMILSIDLLNYTSLYAKISISRALPTKDVACAILLLAFVLVMEGWMWLRRMEFKAARSIIERITKSFDLSPATR